MNEETVLCIFLETSIVLGFFGWIAAMIYFTKKNKIILETIKCGCSPVLAHRLFRDTGDELAIVQLLSNQSLDRDAKKTAQVS